MVRFQLFNVKSGPEYFIGANNTFRPCFTIAKYFPEIGSTNL